MQSGLSKRLHNCIIPLASQQRALCQRAELAATFVGVTDADQNRGRMQVARRAAKGGAEGATSALRRAGDEMRSPVAAAVTCVRRSSTVCVTRPAPQAPTCTMARTTSADTSWHRVKQICSLESRGVARKANTRRAACRSRATSGRFADILPVERALKCGPRERPLHECSCMHAPQEHGQHERCHTKL